MNFHTFCCRMYFSKPTIHTNAMFFMFFQNLLFLKWRDKGKKYPEVSTQEHLVYGSFLRGKYTLKGIKMRQICPSVKYANSQPLSWPKMLREIFGQLTGWLLIFFTEGQICPIFIASRVYLPLRKLPYTQCSWVEARLSNSWV